MLNLKKSLYIKDLLQLALEELARQFAILGATNTPSPKIVGPEDVLIENLAASNQATQGSLTFAVGPQYLQEAMAGGASAVIITPELLEENPTLATIVTPEPRLLFSIMLGLGGQHLIPPAVPGAAFFVDEKSVEIGTDVIFGPGVYIGRNVKIGAGSQIMAMSYIEDNVEIGPDTIIHPRVVLRWGVSLGPRCQVHAGAIIGSDGFGYSQVPDIKNGRLWHVKNPHMGSVKIGADVEIGSQSCIDRGLVSDTIIEDGVKIDNLVQIGHNVHLHRDCIVVAQTGIGGHADIGERVFLLGQSGLGPGVVIGHDAVISAQSGVGSGRIPAGRQLWTGAPARPNNEVYQQRALASSQLPKLRKFFQCLKKATDISELKKTFFDKTKD